MSKGKINIENIPMFFILGRPRSGTTLLASLFDAHPNVILPFECPLIINLANKYSKNTKWDEDKLKEFSSDVFSQRKFEAWRLSESEIYDYLIQYKGDNSFETIIKALYSRFNSFFDKDEIKLIGDKNPVYSIYSKNLIKLFPKAKFIHLTRDYRDNILSIKNVDFEAPVTSLLAFRWKYAERRILKSKEQFRDSFYSLRYEDLVSDPKRELKELCEFLNIEYKPSVLEFHKIKDKLFEDFDKEHVLRYHSSLLRPITNDKIYGWKQKMSDKDVKVSDRIVGRYAELNGYERKFEKAKFVGVVSLIWICYGYFSYFQRYVVDVLPTCIKMRIRNRGPLMAVLFNRYFTKK